MSRIRAYIGRLPQFDSTFTLVGILGIYVVCILLSFVIGLGLPSGLGRFYDMLLIGSAGLIILILLNFVISFLIGFIRIRFPRIVLGAFISSFGLISFILYYSDIAYWAAAILAFIMIVIGYTISTSIFLVIKPRFSLFIRYSYVVLSVILLILAAVWFYELLPSSYTEESEQEFQLDTALVNALEAENPAERGPYSFQTLTYGSGEDRHRDEFAEDVDIKTRTMDGSEFIERWKWLRKLFWGFDKTNLPINGRVWLPEGEGTFPLVLIVHGNHLMEDFSDAGYAYLGELLASKGYITISVDENFINYSAWSGGLSNDMELRSWVLLQHIEEIRRLNEQPGHPLSAKVDMKRIGLIGHSRGGQAIVLAAEDPTIHDDVKAVIAIAPTDRQEDNEYLKLNDVNYLTIQGSQDADVSTFTGDRQYERATIGNSGSHYLFKSSLYVKGANHGQFNTRWGNQDLSLPAGLLLNKRDIMDGNKQRQIAKVYIAALLDISFNHASTYVPMFKDYRMAANWLPATSYRNRFEDSNFIRISDFEEDHNIETTSISNGTINANNLVEWKEVIEKDRQDASKQNRSVHLSWSEQEASYEINLPAHGWTAQLTEQSVITFSLANLMAEPIKGIMIELESEDGVKIHKSLRTYQRIQPAIYTQFTKSRYLEQAVRKGRYGAATESVLQTYMIPISHFTDEYQSFDLKSISVIRFIFDQQEDGNILLDDIGFN